jgi:hypothetical protein
MGSKPTPRDREPANRERQKREPEWIDPPEGFDPERFVESAPWRFAKTIPHIPHWYTVRGQTPDENFEAFVNYIRKHGYRARWGRRVNTYYELGESKVLDDGSSDCRDDDHQSGAPVGQHNAAVRLRDWRRLTTSSSVARSGPPPLTRAVRFAAPSTTLLLCPQPSSTSPTAPT